jgi:hypothetical protein
MYEVVTTGRISKKDISKVYQGKLNKAKVLCSNSHRSYDAFAKSNTIIHKKFNASKGQKTVDKISLLTPFFKIVDDSNLLEVAL